jgi:hypothetical protein
VLVDQVERVQSIFIRFDLGGLGGTDMLLYSSRWFESYMFLSYTIFRIFNRVMGHMTYFIFESVNVLLAS